MKNICNHYKDIVERAILAGILEEENRSFYLSAIQEENDSELSELETRLAMEEGNKSNFSFEGKSEKDNGIQTAKRFNKLNRKEELTKQLLSKDEDQSFMSEDGIENWSILNIKKKSNDDTDSDSTFSLVKTFNTSIAQKPNSTSVISKSVKRIGKNQIIDFNIPIYIDAKKKRTSVESHYPPSNSKKYKIPYWHKYESNSPNVKRNAANASNESILPKPEFLNSNKKSSMPPKTFKSFVHTSTMSNEFNNPAAGKHEVRARNKLSYNKSIHTCSTQTNGNQVQEGYQYTVPSSSKVQSEFRRINCKQTKGPTQEFEFYRELEDEEYSDRMKLEESSYFKRNKQSVYKKQKSKNILPNFRSAAKCKHCEHSCRSSKYEENSTDNRETYSEGDVSVCDAPTLKNYNSKDHGGPLNVNIFCQFHLEDEAKNNNDPENQQLTGNSSQTTTDKIKETEEHFPINGKTDHESKLQRLTKLFTNLKIKKKKKKLDNPTN